ncbi:hypothetical protein N7468_010235 [Penicillium chermesinum]|uniref:Uncharacterized protein n=1 Tax=Penicillium chermesinum TaxID=63820 RepID=A0A9W9NCA7_9EURO|nr:uncharacterized protein N7468_010235 [Penicillium chermesinum]KAJ5217227.1 hypothetical protein N7468_010235 [Penicillium chermesinum]KAJ6171156.1 hypothetical protein N7470_000223 [Penicillium chermesinum]
MDPSASKYHVSVGIPPATADKALLLVILADFDEAHKKKLIEHLQSPDANYVIEPWCPSPSVLRLLAPQTDRRDSLSTLYALAILAHRAGREGFIVADEATKRRVEGHFPVRGERAVISVVMVAVRKDESTGRLRVIVKRESMRGEDDSEEGDIEEEADGSEREREREGQKFDLSTALRSFEVKYDFQNAQRLDKEPAIYFELGFELHDPEDLPFTPCTADYFAFEASTNGLVQAMAESTPLPPELVMDVTARANRQIGEPIPLPEDLQTAHTDPVINILVCFPTTEGQRAELQAVLQKAVHERFEDLALQRKNEKGDQDADENKANEGALEDECQEPSVRLIPWEKDHKPSRRDITIMHEGLISKIEWEHYRKKFKAPYILSATIQGEDLLSCQLLSICETTLGLGVYWTSLRDIVKQKQCSDEWEACGKFEDNVELLPYPKIQTGFDKPFYPTPRPGYPAGRYLSLALIFLTNKLTRSQIESIYKEVVQLGQYDDPSFRKVVCPVPWKEGEEDAEDGTVEDMYRLYQEYRERCEGSVVFVDQQSAVDHKVIVTGALSFSSYGRPDVDELLKDVPNAKFRGFQYGRKKGREAWCVWANISLGNMDIEECFDDESDVNTYLRPDWPYHHKLDEFGDWVDSDAGEDEG